MNFPGTIFRGDQRDLDQNRLSKDFCRDDTYTKLYLYLKTCGLTDIRGGYKISEIEHIPQNEGEKWWFIFCLSMDWPVLLASRVHFTLGNESVSTRDAVKGRW